MRALRCALALVIASAIWLALSVTIVLWPAATLGLVTVAMWLRRGTIATPGAVLRAVRQHLRAIIVWGVVNAPIVALALALERNDFLAESISPVARIILRAAVIAWCVLQLYAVPLLLVQRDGRMLSAWRSAGLLALSAPATTIGLGLLAALLVAITFAWPVPLLLIAPGLLAWLGSAAVDSHLRSYGYEPEVQQLAASD